MLLVRGRHEMWFASMSTHTRQQRSREERIQIHLWLSGEWEKYLAIILGEVRQRLRSVHSCVLFWAVVHTQQKLTHAEAPTEWKATLLRHGGCFSATSASLAISSLGFQDSAPWTEPCLQWAISHTVSPTPPFSRTVGHSSLPTDSVSVTQLLARVYSPLPISGSAMVSCESVQSTETMAMCRSTSGAGCPAPSSLWKQRPRQGLFSVMFTHLCTFDEAAVWSGARHSCDRCHVSLKQGDYDGPLQKTSSGQTSSIQARYGALGYWPV